MEYLQRNKNYKEVPIRKWDELVKREKKHRSDPRKEEWIFRGQPKREHCLQTFLERVIADIGMKDENDRKDCNRKLEQLLENGLNGKSVYDIEKGLIRRFQRQYYHFDLRVPEKGDVIEWLGVMRHYGAPTRLLDWTYSFYIAAFFALEESGGACALWALRTKSLTKRVESVLGERAEILKNDPDIRKEETWAAIFQKSPLAFAYPVNPFRLNERLVLQQGVFLCPGDISKPFENNLSAVLPQHNKSSYMLFKYIIDFDVEERRNALLQLHRMNINRATLFPGLEGFAKSLKTLLISPANLLHSGEK